ncbi:hypothetical protein SCALM49S_09766 [Streptomyces californicus]
MEYTVYSELLEEEKRQRAFAVSTPDGPVVVHLGGIGHRGAHRDAARVRAGEAVPKLATRLPDRVPAALR